jgi:hypothetical protein
VPTKPKPTSQKSKKKRSTNTKPHQRQHHKPPTNPKQQNSTKNQNTTPQQGGQQITPTIDTPNQPDISNDQTTREASATRQPQIGRADPQECHSPQPPPDHITVRSTLESDDVMTIIHNIVARESHNITNSRKKISHCDNIEHKVGELLQTTRSLNTNPLNTSHSSKWRSTNKEDILLGATNQTKIEYMKNNFTWINLTEPTKTRSNLRKAISSANASTQPTRTVMLIHHNQTTLNQIKNHNTKQGKKVIITSIHRFPPRTVIIMDAETSQTTKYRQTTSTIQTRKPNTEPLVLITIESNMNKSPLKYVYNPEHWSMPLLSEQAKINPTKNKRNEQQQRPVLTWYREFNGYLNTNDNPRKRKRDHNSKNAETTSKLKGAIGFLPPGIRDYLINNGVDYQVVTAKNLEKISNILMQAARKAHCNYMQHKQEQQFGTTNIK